MTEWRGTTEQTVWKWCKRDSVHDRNHTYPPPPSLDHPHTSLGGRGGCAAQNVTGVAKQLIGRGARVSESECVSLGFNCCLRRHGVGRLRDLKAKDESSKYSGFEAYGPGYTQIDLKYRPQMANDTSQEYLFLATDRAPVGSSLPFIATRLRPMLGVICMTWNVHARSVSAAC